ncbi:MAG: thioredoxin [Patescibacteria group bacterium]|nr:thioredoxin [Patescibacteria group bacterium]
MVITDKNFEKEVLESKDLVLVDFWASWCGPCTMLAPVIKELADEYKKKKVKILKLDIDKNSKTAMKFKVMSIPTILIFKGGKIKKQLIGLQAKEELKKIIDKLI